MPPNTVLVTYTLHPPSSPHLPLAIDGIRAQLPLRNLHWKSSTRTSLRTIQELPVELVELGEVPPSREVGGSVLEAPLVNVVFVACEDAEVYKTSTRSFIRDWLSLLAARRHVHAPLIVLVNPPSADKAGAGSGKNVFGRDKGVLGKLKADFNTGKRDRCAQINLPSGDITDPTAWPEVINKLKESIVAAFDGAIHEREEEVKRGEAQRLTVGWNFCTWFLLKESLAHSFEGVNLHEDALIVYEELEASFIQVLKEQNLSWFGKLGASSPNDDSLPILDTSRKRYRELLQTSQISIFDFRVYVFARQAVLLGRLGRITEIAKRGQWFVASLTRRLRESEGDLAEHFIAGWTYTACMDIVARCDEWSRIDRPNGDYSGLIAYESARSELLDIARIQVERIGVASGHLPNTYPFSPPSEIITQPDDVLFESSDAGMSDTSPEDAPPAPRPSLSNPQLLDAMADAGKFRGMYLGLTRKAMIAYESCGKANSVVRLRADLAAVALHTSDWAAAYDLCKTLAQGCADKHIWGPVARFALEGALRAHRELGKEKDGEWADIALAYLSSCASDFGKTREADASQGDQRGELKGVLQGLADLREETEASEHAAFDVSLLEHDTATSDEAGVSILTLRVTNRLLETVTVNSVVIELHEELLGQIGYETGPTELAPGLNIVQARSGTSVQGVFSLSSTSVRLGKALFHYSPAEVVDVRVRRDPLGVRAALRMPYDIALDKPSQVILEIQAGQCPLENARVEVLSMSPEVGFELDGASSLNKDHVVEVSEEGVSVGDLAEGKKIELAIPLAGSAASERAQAQIRISYTAQGEAREWIDAQGLFTGLPLTVNVQDFFRPSCLVSHFTIASDGDERLRVAGVELRADSKDGYKVESCSTSDESHVVSVGQPLSCLFKIRQAASAKSTAAAAVLRLVIRYRRLDEEVRELVEGSMTNEPASKRASLLRDLERTRGDWLARYTATGKLPSLDGVELVRKNSESSGRWRTLEIPVDVPQRKLLASVRITPSTSTPIYEGRPLTVNLRITTCSSWAAQPSNGSNGSNGSGGSDASDASSSKPTPTPMVFDVLAPGEDWIVLGSKKGWFVASEPAETTLTLVPMRSGIIPLPTVSVQVVSTPRSGRTTSNANSTANANADTDAAAADAGSTQGFAAQLGTEPCETHVENAAEVIRVLPASKEVMVMVPVVPAVPVRG